MTYPIYQKSSSIPAYSGITINISNPTLNAAPLNTNCPSHSSNCLPQQPSFTVEQIPMANDPRYVNPAQYGMTTPVNQPVLPMQNIQQPQQVVNPIESQMTFPQNLNTAEQVVNPQVNQQQSYPPQYYLNNYNYIQNGDKGNSQTPVVQMKDNNVSPETNVKNDSQNQIITEEDMTSSKEIINELDSRAAEQKDLEKNGKKTRVIALTNEYIMSLENYLNNPNSEIRLMAAKEVLTRLDEDKERFDDAALNALLNKMLQDPNKLIRIAALSAFSSQLASGNEFTTQLLTKIQNDPNADKEDVVQAADILLKMSASTEVRYTPVKQAAQPANNKELEASQKQVEQLRGQLEQYKQQEIEKILQQQMA